MSRHVVQLAPAAEADIREAFIWYRERVLRRFPHSVIYEVQQNMITVLAVAHHRRKPGSWTTVKA